MNELDERWAEMLNAATVKAAELGRSGVADYLKLRADNDLIRETGVRWLFESLIAIATTRESAALGVTAERSEPHNFAYGRSNIVGSVLTLRHGVRCLSLEAGWTRTPTDGVMKGGALAIGRILHFGMPKSNGDLLLVRSGGQVSWDEVTNSQEKMRFDSERLLYHFNLFLGM